MVLVTPGRFAFAVRKVIEADIPTVEEAMKSEENDEWK